MAFRLEKHRPMGAELRRILGDEFDQAFELLAHRSPDERAIHEVRKSLKKIRAVIHLLRVPLCKDYETLNGRLRGAAHRLAALRDADVAGKTFRVLRRRYPRELRVAVDDVTRGLRRHRREARAQSAGVPARVAVAVRRSQPSTLEAIGRVARVTTVRAGLIRGYRRARKTMAPLGSTSDAVAFHLWRRRVKDHWYHLRLFEGLHPKPLARARQLHRLETWLGDDHDLTLLAGIILAKPRRFGNARITTLVLGCIVKRQAWLRRRALRLGHRLFSAPAHRFARSAATWRSPRAKRPVLAKAKPLVAA